MPVHSPAIKPVATLALASHPRRVLAAPAPARPDEVALVVTRSSDNTPAHGTCALCWTGPGPLAGSVAQRGAREQDATLSICSRCLVTLEMLAVQFVPHLHLCIEPTGMSPTRFSIRNPLVVSGVAVALCLFGLFAYTSLGVAIAPNVNVPQAVVTLPILAPTRRPSKPT